MEQLARTTPSPDGRLVVYSIAVPATGRCDAVWRFGGSVSTLRRHNRHVPVVLFVHGEPTAELISICKVHAVELRRLEPWPVRLAALSPSGWPVFAGARLLARLLVFEEITALAPSQVLLCDEDSIVYRDVDVLFDAYHRADLVAREQLGCNRSPHGIDRRVLDEPLLARLATGEGIPIVPPFEPGVMLLNHDVWRRAAGLQARLADYAWRLAVGASLVTIAGRPSAGVDLTALRATDDDVLRAMPFPSRDQRLLVDVAWWLTLGHVDGLVTDDFAPTDVAIGHEVAAPCAGDDWVIGHYATDSTGCLAGWLHERALSLAS